MIASRLILQGVMDMKQLLATVLIVLTLLAHSSYSQEIKVVTTEWAPFVVEENTEVFGVTTEIVRATLAKAGIKAEIGLYPWKRAIVTAKENPNILIYPLIRNEEREPHFIWVVPMLSVKVSLHKLKNRKDIVINSLEDAKKYKIGVLREAAMHLMLLRQGFSDGIQLEPESTNGQNVKKLFAKRIDLNADSSLVVAYEAKKLGLSAMEMEEVFPLFENEVYMAFGKDTPEEPIERIKAAFNQLKSDGIIGSIIDKYR